MTKIEKQMNKASEYTAIVRPVTEDGQVYYEATFRELRRGLVATGDSPSEALECLLDELPEFVEESQKMGSDLPDPIAEQPWESFSGKATIRMPKSLHYKLHVLAEEEECSLNTLMVTALSWAAEYKHCLLRPVLPQALIQINAHPQRSALGGVWAPFIPTTAPSENLGVHATPLLGPGKNV